MRADGRQLFGRAVHRDALHLLALDHVEQIRQPDDMVEVGMGEKDIELARQQMIADPIHGRARVEHDPLLRQHEAGGLPLVVGMVAGGAQQDELHVGWSVSKSGTHCVTLAGDQLFECSFQAVEHLAGALDQQERQLLDRGGRSSDS